VDGVTNVITLSKICAEGRREACKQMNVSGMHAHAEPETPHHFHVIGCICLLSGIVIYELMQ